MERPGKRLTSLFVILSELMGLAFLSDPYTPQINTSPLQAWVCVCVCAWSYARVCVCVACIQLKSSASRRHSGEKETFSHSLQSRVGLQGGFLTRQRLPIQKKQVATSLSPVELAELWDLIICGEHSHRQQRNFTV